MATDNLQEYDSGQSSENKPTEISNDSQSLSKYDLQALQRSGQGDSQSSQDKKMLDERLWLDANVNKYDDVLRKNFDSSVKTFSENIINYLSRITQAVYGAFFVVDHENELIEAKAGYACTVDTMERVSFKFGEGIIGQVAKTRELFVLDNVETQLNSSIGRMNSSFLMVSPLVFHNTVYGILEINTLSPLPPHYIKLIKRISFNTAAVLQNILQAQNTKRLLIDSLQQSQEFKSQGELLARLQKKLEDVKDELSRKQNELDQLHNQFPDVAISHTEPETNNFTVVEGEEAPQGVHVELQQNQSQIEALQEELRLKSVELQKVSTVLKDAQLQLLDLQNQSKEAQSQLKHYQYIEEELIKAKELAQNVEKKLYEKEDELQDALAKIAYNRDDSSQLSAYSSNDQSQLGETISELERKNVGLEKELSQNRKDMDLLKETIKWKDAEIERQDEALLERKKELQTIRENFEEVKNDNLRNLEEVVKQGKTINEQESELKNLQQHLASQVSEEEAQQLRNEIQKKEEFIKDLKSQVQNLGSMPSSEEDKNLLHQKENEIASLRQQLKEIQENDEVEELRNQILHKDATIEELNNRIENKEGDPELLQQWIDYAEGLKQEMVQKNEELEAIQKEKLEQVEQVKAQLEEISQLNQALLAAKSEDNSEQLRGQLEEKEAEISQLNQEIQRQSHEYAQLDVRFKDFEDKLSQKQKELEAVIQKNREREEQYNVQIKELETTRTKLRKREDELMVSQYLLNQAQGEAGGAGSSESLQIALEQKEKIIRQKDQEIQSLHQENHSLRREGEAHPDAYHLKQVVDSKDEMIEKLRDELSSYSQRVQEVSPSSEDAQVSSQEQAEKLKELEALQNEAENLREQTNSLRIEVENLRDQLQQKDAAFQNLLTQQNTDVVPSPDEISNLKEKLSQKEQDIQQINERTFLQVEALENLKSEVEQKDQLIQKLRDELEQAQVGGNASSGEAEVQKYIDQLREKETEILRQSEALSTLRQQLFDKEKALSETQKQLKEVNTENPSLAQADLNQKLAELETISQDLEKRKTELDRKAEFLQDRENQLQERQEQADKADQESTKSQESGEISDLANPALAEIESLRREIKEKEQHLQQREKELSLLFNKINTTFAAIEINMDGQIHTVNNKFLMMLGMKVEDVTDKPYHSLLLPEYVESKEHKILWQGLRMGVPQTVDKLICVGNKGKQIPMSVTFIPIPGMDGRPYEVVKLVNQVHKEAPVQEASPVSSEEAPAPTATSSKLPHEEKELIRAVNNSFIIAELDLEGKMIRVNKQFLTFLGYSEKEVMGKHHRNFIDITERSSESYLDIIRGLSNGMFASEIFKYVGKEGERVRLRSYFNPILDESSNPKKVLVISQFVN